MFWRESSSYTGVIEISSEIVKEVADVAMFLGLTTLANHCFNILTESLNNKNCLDLLEYSESCVHLGTELTVECLKKICRNFKEFVDNPYFCDLSSITMKILLKQERLTYTEEDLFVAVKKWLTYDLENREQFVDALIGEIRFEDCSSDFAQAHILKNNPLLESTNFKDCLMNFFETSWGKIKISTTQEERKNLLTKSQEKNLCVFKGIELFSYNKLNKSILDMITEIDDCRSDFGCTTFGENNVFICGGDTDEETTSTCKYFLTQRRC